MRTQLTERELEVLRHVSHGESNREIGKAMYLSEYTVKSHVQRIFKKLGARDRAHAVAIGIRSGIIT